LYVCIESPFLRLRERVGTSPLSTEVASAQASASG
jgi:hypothetical protein